PPSRARADDGGDVTEFQGAQERMDQDAVAYLDGDLHQVFVGAMHRIARLERRDPRPTEPLECGACLRRRLEQRPVLGLESAVAEDAYRACQVNLALLHHHSYARMVRIG